MSDRQSKPTFVSCDLDIIIKRAITRRYSVVQVDRSSGFLVVLLKIRSHTIRLRSEKTAVRPDPISRDIGRRNVFVNIMMHASMNP